MDGATSLMRHLIPDPVPPVISIYPSVRTTFISSLRISCHVGTTRIWRSTVVHPKSVLTLVFSDLHRGRGEFTL